LSARIGYGICLVRDKRSLRRRARRARKLDVSDIFSNESSMNRFERQPTGVAEARVEFHDGDFRITRPGGFVRCAVTGAPIPIEELRYWSVDRQEAYANPEAVLKRLASRF
jgi:hypothetical protein